MARYLIINADDFGASIGVNRGIIEAHERAIVTSTSLMVHREAVEDAVARAADHPRLDLGLHLEFGEWEYRDGWEPVRQVIDARDAAAVQAEVASQIDRFRELVDGDPSHLDSHQHVHLSEPAAAIVAQAGADLGVPVRMLGDEITYEGAFYGKGKDGSPLLDAITVESLVGIIDRLAPGVTELCCHPGYADDLTSSYRDERAVELRALCDARVRAALEREHVELVRFADLTS